MISSLPQKKNGKFHIRNMEQNLTTLYAKVLRYHSLKRESYVSGSRGSCGWCIWFPDLNKNNWGHSPIRTKNVVSTSYLILYISSSIILSFSPFVTLRHLTFLILKELIHLTSHLHHHHHHHHWVVIQIHPQSLSCGQILPWNFSLTIICHLKYRISQNFRKKAKVNVHLYVSTSENVCNHPIL